MLLHVLETFGTLERNKPLLQFPLHLKSPNNHCVLILLSLKRGYFEHLQFPIKLEHTKVIGHRRVHAMGHCDHGLIFTLEFLYSSHIVQHRLAEALRRHEGSQQRQHCLAAVQVALRTPVSCIQFGKFLLHRLRHLSFLLLRRQRAVLTVPMCHGAFHSLSIVSATDRWFAESFMQGPRSQH